MSRVWQDADSAVLTPDVVEWGAGSVLTGVTIATTDVFPGGLSQRCVVFNGASAAQVRSRSGLALDVAWMRGDFKIAAGAIANVFGVCAMRDAAGTALAGLSIRADGHLQIYAAGGPGISVIAMPTPLPRGESVELELFVDRLRGLVNARVNGVSFSGVVWAAMDTTNPIDQVSYGPSNTAPGVSVRLDNCAVNSAEGPANSSWCGPGTVGMLVPNGQTGPIPAATWFAQSGGAPTFAEVDDLPSAVDDATTYVKETLWHLGSSIHFTLPALPDGTLVSAICAGMRGGGTSVAERRGFVQFIDARGRLRYGNQDLDWNLNGWKTIYPALTAEMEWYGAPGADDVPQPRPWRMLTADYLASMAFQLVRYTGTGDLRFTALWLSVDAFSVGLPASPPIRRAPRVLADFGP